MTTRSQDESLARYLAGQMNPVEREAFEQQVAADPELSQALYAEVNLTSSLNEAARAGGNVARPRRGRSPWQRRALRWGVPVAAAAGVVLMIVSRPSNDPVFRGEHAAIEILTPQETIASWPAEFRWTADVTARRYRIEFFDATSQRFYQKVTSDTFVSLEREVFTQPSANEGFWRVVPLDETNLPGMPSSPQPFRIADEEP